MRKAEFILFGLLLTIIIPLEIFCAYLAYETLGEVMSGLYFLAVGFNLLFVAVALRYRTLAAMGVVILALAIIPYQLLLGQRLLTVQTEAARIVSYVYEQRLQTGQFPPDLSSYTFHNLEAKPYIQQYQLDHTRGGFILAYRVGAETTSHTFSPQDGWQYYPD